jgi:hypothetical protein
MMTLNDFIDQFEAPAIESYTKRLPNGTLYHPAVTGIPLYCLRHVTKLRTSKPPKGLLKEENNVIFVVW